MATIIANSYANKHFDVQHVHVSVLLLNGGGIDTLTLSQPKLNLTKLRKLLISNCTSDKT